MKGQAMAEFILVCAVLVIALFVPQVDEEPVAVWLLREVAALFERWSFVISIL
ncbi:MAG: hypothetical protein LBE59_10660 [Nevskiaceae bacterium]|nr:hypothetical protein [Nevskiaceae bacterium]